MTTVPPQAEGGPPRLEPEALARWAGGSWEPCPPAAVCAISNDTRALEAGHLYVALAGERFDGHAFVVEAARRGAAGAIVRADWRRETDAAFPLLRVADPLGALSAMAAAYRRELAPRCIGVTGSAGKTTVKEWTAGVAATRYVTARTRGNWNNHVGLPLSLLRMPGDTQVGVFEIGTNHPGEIAHLAEILRPDWGIVTNVAAAHIEHFGSVAAIANEKADLLRALPTDGLAFVCVDDAHAPLLREASRAPVVTVSARGPADYMLAPREAGSRAITVIETASGERLQCTLPAAGAFPAINALFAVAVGRCLGLDRATLERALAMDMNLPLRWQREQVDGVLVINDAYNANPLSMREALKTFHEEAVPGGRWLVLGGMLELGAHAEDEHVALGRAVADYGDWAGLIAVGGLGDCIGRGADAAGFPATRIHCCPAASDAARLLAARTRPGDGVLLKASRGIRLEDVLNHWRQGRVPAPA